MKLAIFTLLFSLLFSAQTHAWVINADFESGVIGEKAAGTDAFHGAKKLTVFDNKHIKSGSKSAKATITQGSDGWTEWGGKWNFPSVLHEGDELWYRISVRLQPDWDWKVGSKGTWRIHTISNTGANEGYLDSLLYNHQFRVGSEVSPKLFNENNGPAQYLSPIPRGEWHTYEAHIKFHSVPGKAIYRVWKDGDLVFEDLQTNTLRQSTSYSDLVYAFGYFDQGGPIQTQSLWIDSVAITNERPSNTDKHGNPFIGVGQANFTAPPNAPSIVE